MFAVVVGGGGGVSFMLLWHSLSAVFLWLFFFLLFVTRVLFLLYSSHIFCWFGIFVFHYRRENDKILNKRLFCIWCCCYLFIFMFFPSFVIQILWKCDTMTGLFLYEWDLLCAFANGCNLMIKIIILAHSTRTHTVSTWL